MYSANGIGPATAIRRRISFSSGEESSGIFCNHRPHRREDESDYARYYQRDRKQHSHGQAAPKKAELHIGFAEKLAKNAQHAIDEGETAADEAGPLKRAATHENAEHRQEHQAFEGGFVKLAWMTRDRAAGGKDHGPGHVAWTAPQFAIDEVGDADEKYSDWGNRERHIAERQNGNTAPQRENDRHEDAAQHAPMKGHSAVPYLKNFAWTLAEVEKVVEQDVADTAAENNSERYPNYEVIVRRDRKWRRPAP